MDRLPGSRGAEAFDQGCRPGTGEHLIPLPIERMPVPCRSRAVATDISTCFSFLRPKATVIRCLHRGPVQRKRRALRAGSPRCPQLLTTRNNAPRPSDGADERTLADNARHPDLFAQRVQHPGLACAASPRVALPQLWQLAFLDRLAHVQLHRSTGAVSPCVTDTFSPQVSFDLSRRADAGS